MVIGLAYYHSGETTKALKASVEILTPAQIALQKVNGLISASGNALYRFGNRDPISAQQLHVVLDRLVEVEEATFTGRSKTKEKPFRTGLDAARLRAIFHAYVDEERRDPADDATAQLKNELFTTLDHLRRRVRATKPPPGADGRAAQSWNTFHNLMGTTKNVLLRYFQRDRIRLETADRPIAAAILVIASLPLPSFRHLKINHRTPAKYLHVTDIESAQGALKRYRIALLDLQDAVDSGLLGSSYFEALSMSRNLLSEARNKTSLAGKNLSEHFQHIQKSATAAAERGGRLFLALALVGLVLSLSIAYWLRKSMSRIVGTLLEGADRISAGAFDVEIEPRGSDELGKLAVRFNQMARNLQQKDDDLHSHIADLNETKKRLGTSNKDLEHRVKQRTADLKRRETALANSEKRFRDFADASSDWYWEMDGALRFSYFSDPFQAVTSVDPAMLLGKTREETGIPNVDKRQWRRHLDDLHNHRPFRNFVHPQAKDGQTVWISINGIPFVDDDGNFSGYRGNGNNITDLVEAEMEAKAARTEAESANRAKSRFLATMSHEIRTPMHAVLGISDLLLQGKLTPEQKQLTETLSDSGKTLMKIIDDILDLSKIEADRLILDSEDFDLLYSLESVLNLFAETASKKGLLLERDLDASLPRYHHGDSSRLRQILLNLLSNAIKFTERGKVLLRATVEEETPDGCVLKFAITDTGIGLSPEQQAHIFDAFAQADESSTRHYGGTGLGLAICKQLVELMGGRIGVESEFGQGATFFFTVNFAKPSDAFVPAGAWEAPKSATATVQGGNQTETVSERQFAAHVLVAEDNPVNQDLARRILEHLGCTVDIVCDGAEAIQALEKNDYGLVFMDCHMPNLDGFEATERIRAAEQTESANRDSAPLPIIAVTASAMQEDHDRCLAVGMNAWVTKPFSIDHLREVLQRWAPHREPTAAGEATPRAGDEQEASATANSTRASPLDQAALDAIRVIETPENPNFLETIIAKYLVSAEELLASLGDALRHGDAKALHAAAHSLKSSSANVGAAGLSEFCRVLEEMARTDDLANARTLEAAVAQEFASVRAALEAESEEHVAKRNQSA